MKENTNDLIHKLINPIKREKKQKSLKTVEINGHIFNLFDKIVWNWSGELEFQTIQYIGKENDVFYIKTNKAPNCKNTIDSRFLMLNPRPYNK